MKIKSLQILRAIAAWLVVYHHYMQIFYENNVSSALGEFFRYKGGFGVDLFFVLSGFVMYLTASRPEISARVFFIKRLFRVFPAYWFYTLILFILLSVFPKEFSFTSYNLVSVLQSLFFIPHENPSGIGNFPLLTVGWTLNYELLFYTILTICIFFSRKHSFKFCSLIILVCVVLFKDTDNSIYSVLKNKQMLQFVFGFFVGWVYKSISIGDNKYTLLGVTFLAISTLIFTDYVKYATFQKTIAATLMVLGAIFVNKYVPNNCIVNFVVKMGDYSYSTYLVHILLIGVLLNVFGNELGMIYEAGVIILLTFLVVLISAFSFKFVENPIIFKGFLKKLDGKKY